MQVLLPFIIRGSFYKNGFPSSLPPAKEGALAELPADNLQNASRMSYGFSQADR
jgi:hypothetical protein